MNISAIRKKVPRLSLLNRCAQHNHTDIWLVGGFLRDVYLGKAAHPFDFDFCVQNNTTAVAQSFARAVGAKCIILDEKEESLRVAVKHKKGFVRYDFTRMRARTLPEDLALRDFTINALAITLKGSEGLLDPCCGLDDLAGRVIRVPQAKVITYDPLRILRAFSFMVRLGFRIDTGTLDLLARHKRKLAAVSRERLNEELFKILGCDNSYEAIVLMDKLKIIDEFIPYVDRTRGVTQGDYHHLDVWKHSLETLRQFEFLYRKNFRRSRYFNAYLNEELVSGRRRVQVVKLACILHDIGKPKAKKKSGKKTIFHAHEKIGSDLAERIASGLRFSLREQELLKKLIFWHLRPGYLADQVTPSPRAVYRFFRDTQEEGPGVVLLSLADWRATRGPATNARKRLRHERIMLRLARRYFCHKDKKPLVKIIDGHDVMRVFSIKASPLVGDVLKAVREEQALGRVRTKTQAYCLARRIIAKENEPQGAL